MKERHRKRKLCRGLLLAATLLLAGCGSSAGQQVWKDSRTAAMLGDEEICLGEVLFYTRMNQLQWEQAYAGELGPEFWTVQAGGDKSTFADALKEQVMTGISRVHVLKAHAEEFQVELTEEEKAEIEAQTRDFLLEYSKEVLEAAGADEKTVKSVLTDQKLAEKTAAAAAEDPGIREEETALGKLTYCMFAAAGTFDADGNYAEPAEEVLAQKKQEAEAFASCCAESGDLAAAAEEQGLTCVDAYFNGETDGGLPAELAEAARRLEPGQITEAIRTGDGYCVAQYVKERDEAAGEQYREQLTEEKKRRQLDELCSRWLEETPFSVISEVWDTVMPDRVLFVE